MAASAKPRQVLECLSLIGRKDRIQKLKENETCRESVISMLQGQISRKNSNASTEFMNAGFEAILAAKSYDPELYNLLCELMQVSLFPHADYQKIFNPIQWAKENPTEENTNRILEHKDEFIHPLRCTVALELLHSSYKTEIRKHGQSVPFMDLVSRAGFSHLQVSVPPEDLTSIHCELVITFMKILHDSKLTRVGHNNTRSSHIIANAVKALMSGTEITSLDIEKLLEGVLELDPGILIMVIGELWREWIKGSYLNVMRQLAVYFAKRNEPQTIFKDNFNQSRILYQTKSIDFDADFGPIFRNMAEHILPSRKIEFIKFLVHQVEIFLEDERMNEAKGKRLVMHHIETILICISAQLDTISFESITISSQDEAELFSELSKIRHFLEIFDPDFIGWSTTLVAWWRLEREHRLFETNDNQLFTKKILEKLDENLTWKKTPKPISRIEFQIEVEQCHWSCITGFQLEKQVVQFLDVFGSEKLEEISYDCVEKICEMSSDIYQLEPEKFLKTIGVHLNSTSTSRKMMAMQLLEDDQEIYFDALKKDSKIINEIPITFLTKEKLDILVEELLQGQINYELVYQILHSSIGWQVEQSFGKKFYKKVMKLEINDKKINREKICHISEAVITNLAKKHPDRLFTEMEKYPNLPEQIAFAWMKILFEKLEKYDENEELNVNQAKTISWDVLNHMVSQNECSKLVTIAIKTFIKSKEIIMDKESEKFNKIEIDFLRLVLDKLYIIKDMVDFSSLEVISLILGTLATHSTREDFLKILSSRPGPEIVKLVWQFLTVKEAQLRVQTFFKDATIDNTSYDYSEELIYSIDTFAKLSDDEDSNKLKKLHISTILQLLEKTPNLKWRLAVSNKLLTDKRIRNPNKNLRIMLGLLQLDVKLKSDEFIELYQFLNNFVRFVPEKQIINLSPAITIIVRILLENILTEEERSIAIGRLKMLKRLVEFINSSSFKKPKTSPVTKQLFSAFGNILSLFIRVYLKCPDDGLAEGIILELLSELHERQINSFMVLLNNDHKKELASLYTTFKNVRKRKLQTV